MKRKILKAALAVILILTMVVAFASCSGSSVADAESASGTISGTSISWSYDKNTKTLTLSGSGPIPDFNASTSVPWYDARHSVVKLEIGNGITDIGNYAFYYMPELETVSFPATVTSFGKYSFAFCSTLSAITVPDSVTSIGDSCFEGCASLKTVFVPSTVTAIGQRAFLACGALEDAIIMAQITEIKSLTFKNCKSLKTLCFHETQRELSSIAPDAFDGAAIGFGAAQFTASTTGAATLTVKYEYEDGTEAAPTYTKEFIRGESYDVASPAIEGFTASQEKVAGTISADTAVTVTYKANAPAEEAPEPEVDDTKEPEEEPKKITVGTVIALVILGIVIVGIVVLAVFMMRSDKKPGQNSADGKKNNKK